MYNISIRGGIVSYDIVAIAVGVVEYVRTGAASQRIVALASEEGIRTFAAIDCILALASDNGIVSSIAIYAGDA